MDSNFSAIGQQKFASPPNFFGNAAKVALGQKTASGNEGKYFSRPPVLASTRGVPALLRQVTEDYKRQLQELGDVHLLSQLINENFGTGIEGTNRAAELLCEKLTKSTGEMAAYLDYSETDIREEAKRLALLDLEIEQKIQFSEKLLGSAVPGKSMQSQFLRLSDPRYWRKALRVRIMRAREHFFLRLQLVGARKETYTSDATVKMRTEQLQRQEMWMREMVIVPLSFSKEASLAGEEFEPISLAKVAKTPAQQFAKLYSFVNAVDQLGIEAGLSSAILTITLEREFHPNPASGNNSWNDSSPRVAHSSFCERWQAISRDLHREGIRTSGLRVVEPHKDGCPHYHVWILYRQESENRILSRVMKYFPNKLKIRAARCKSDNRAKMDIIYDNHAAFLNSTARASIYAGEGVQVELSRIDRNISSGASYAMKYVMKSLNVSDELSSQIGSNPQQFEKNKAKKEKYIETAKRIDAYRSVWGIHQCQLYGIAKCLTKWDELRRLTIAPQHPFLKKLWSLARGGAENGHIPAAAERRGDTKSFIQMLGGLDACRNDRKDTEARYSLGRLLEEKENRYGDPIKKAKGLTLLKKERVRVLLEKVSVVTRVDGPIFT